MTSETSKEKVPKTPASEKTPASNEKQKAHKQELLDEALEETFPASDPVSLTNPTVVHTDDDDDGKEKPKGKRD